MAIPVWINAISKAIPVIQAVSTVILPSLKANSEVPQGVKDAIEDLLVIAEDLKEAIEKNGQRLDKLEKENQFLRIIAFSAVGIAGISLFFVLYLWLAG